MKITRKDKGGEYVKKKIKNALIIVTVVGLLAVAVSASGCETPTPTVIKGTWRSTGAALKPGGLTFSGQLLESPSGPPVPGVTIVIKAYKDINAQEAKVLKTVTTGIGATSQGKFAFTISAKEDQYMLYVAEFLGGNGLAQSATFVGGYRALNYGINSLATKIATLPTSTFGIGGKAQLTSQLIAAKTFVAAGMYSGAATNMDAVLKKLDAASAKNGAPAALVNMDYTAFLIAKDCHWLSGQAWSWPTERTAPQDWKPF